MTTPFLTTKFYIPRSRNSLVDRPRLMARLDQVTLHVLTLVCAPAGYGKSTLLAEWIAKTFKDESFSSKDNRQADQTNVCWLALDPADNDPVRFISYLIMAFESVKPGISSRTVDMLQGFPISPVHSILTVLMNDLQEFAGTTILVLDDYQFISNTDIHESMAFFLDHLPSNVHLVIATRSDPPIPLARLRARGRMTEIRANDLRFSYKETNDLLNQVMLLDLSTDDMNRLDERTEGWIAGLQMAALALKSISQSMQQDKSLFVKNFSGSNRYILDYLVEEVLSHQPRDIQDFLLQTSILENLSGPLCDTVTGMGSVISGDVTSSSQDVLEYLERTNLFLVPLDSDRLWFRYHHLFADLLRARLEKQGSQKVSELHRRASEWYEENQRLPDSINHAIDAGEYDRACLLIDGIVEQMLAHNGTGLLRGWIGRLPPEINVTRPWLCIAQAWSAMFFNDAEKIEQLLVAAENAFRPDDNVDQLKKWKGHIACLRAFVADNRNDVPRTIEMAHLALEYLRPGDAASRPFAKYMLGRAYFISGDFSQAIATLAENVHECVEANVTNIISPSLSMLSKVYRIQGKLHESVEILKEGLAFIEKCDPRRVTVGGLAFTAKAIALGEWNNLEEAEKITRRSLELCEPWISPSAICRCYLVLARILQAQGKLSEAGNVLRLAEESIKGRSPMPEVICDLDAALIGYWLTTHQLSRASRWAQEKVIKIKDRDTFSIPKEQDEITLARVQIAEGKLESALMNLDRLAIATENGGRIGHLIEIRNLQVLAFQARGDMGKALTMLQKSLALAEPEGYIRVFVDEGEQMQEMLRNYVRSFPSVHQTYAQSMLAVFTGTNQSVPSRDHTSILVEPLTAREMEILQLMAEGLSNNQIAEKLILAEGTIKFYVHSVLEKLGVHNRTQAVMEAKIIKLI